MSEPYNPQYRGRIEEWMLVPVGIDYFKKTIYRLAGQIYDDQKHQFPDGVDIITSNVRLVEGGIAYTNTSIYHLGKEYKMTNSIENINKE